MTRDRAPKAAVRQHATATGDSYTRAGRALGGDGAGFSHPFLAWLTARRLSHLPKSPHRGQTRDRPISD